METTTPLRTLALCCPDWPVVAAGAAPDAPVAILEGEGPRRVVTAASPAARQNGVRRGQRLREARRRCPHLVVYRRDAAREAREFEPIAVAAEELAAASVEVVQPGLITVDVPGPARYHGGEGHLAALLRDAVEELTTASGGPIGCGVGIADGSLAATLAARESAARRASAPTAIRVEPGAAANFLAPYPVAVLDQPDLARSLTRSGVHTLGSFAGMTGSDVAGRFGVEGLLAQRLARGLDPRQPAARRSIDALIATHEFDPPAEQDDLVAYVGKALANRLHLGLVMAGVACVRLGIDIVTVSGRGCYRLWRHGDALGGRLSAPAIAERIRWQLEGWRAREPYPIADPVVALRLVPDRLVVDRDGRQVSRDSWDPQESVAWDPPSSWNPRAEGSNPPNRLERAIERVEDLLGPGAVQHPRLAMPGLGADPGPSRTAALPPDPPMQPVTPYPAELRDVTGESIGVMTGRARLTGEPALLTVFGKVLGVTGWAGPWIYDEDRSQPLASRRLARLQCATADGRAWLLAARGGRWQVEGVYS